MEIHSRKLLSLSQSNINRLLLTTALPPALAPTQNELKLTRSEALARTQLGGQLSAFNADIVLVLSILLCGLICALAVSIAVRCILRCASQTCNHHDSPDSSGNDEMNTRSSAPVIRGNEALQVLPSLVYSSKLELTGSGSECTICLSEFKHGVHVRVLPVCHHGFHVRCIDKWLATRCTCPTCRRCLFGVAQQDGSDQSDPTPVVIVHRVSVEATEEY